MIGMGMGAIRHHITVNNRTMNLDAVQAFMNDLYANAGLELPHKFDPVDEVIRVVETLRKQGAGHG